MPSAIRSSVPRLARLVTIAVFAIAASAPMACGSLLGIDSGTARGDASTGDDADPGAFDGALDAPSPPDGALALDASPRTDSGFHGDAEAGCTPDLSWCNTHCGSGLDNCNEPRDCPTECAKGDVCSSNACACQSDSTWCNGRCLDTMDNCGVAKKCPPCASGVTCYSGVCGCMPDPPEKTCGKQQCGQATNNCGLTVNCGVAGTTACPANQVCLDGTNTCCVPDNAAACGTQCQITVTNSCGQKVSCPQSCPNNGVCVNQECCTPTGCGGDCVDSCGQSNNSCCKIVDAGLPPPDGGGPLPDGGVCLPPSAPCAASAACCSGRCSSQGSCVPMCGTTGGPCSTSAQCCYGLTCQPGVAAANASGGTPLPPPLDAATGTGTCQ